MHDHQATLTPLPDGRLLATTPSRYSDGTHGTYPEQGIYDPATGEVVPLIRTCTIDEKFEVLLGTITPYWSRSQSVHSLAVDEGECIVRDIAACFNELDRTMQVNTPQGVERRLVSRLPWRQIGSVHVAAHDAINVSKTLHVFGCDVAWVSGNRWGVDCGPHAMAGECALRTNVLSTRDPRLVARALRPSAEVLRWRLAPRLHWSLGHAARSMRHTEATGPNGVRLFVSASERGENASPLWWVGLGSSVVATVSATHRAAGPGWRRAMQIAEMSFAQATEEGDGYGPPAEST